jgi:demethylmenaquinone methyltransferase / 2-methoxy-6-polyprenyl-1,4-benzoquinol methylase
VTSPSGNDKLAPHPVLASYYRGQEDRSAFVRRLFDEAAPYYDRVNRLFSLGSGAGYRRRCLTRAGLCPGQRVLDVAVGTGLVAREAIAILGQERDVVGLDLSESMLAVARAGLKLSLVRGAGEQLPFAAETFDVVTMGYALRHMSDLLVAFREFHRVLAPGGTLVLLEIGTPTKRLNRIVLSWYLVRIVPLLCRWTGGDAVTPRLMRYYWDTIENCVSGEAIMDAARRSGFASIDCQTDFDIFRTYTGHKV